MCATDPDLGRNDTRLGALHPAEAGLTGLIMAMLAAIPLLATLRGQAIDWPEFAPGLAACAGLLLLGLFARGRRGLGRPALFAVSLALFAGFMTVATILMYLRFPLGRAPADALLFTLDARLGYDWPRAVERLAEWPRLGRVLGMVYRSSLLQVAALLALLCALGQGRSLHRMMLCGALALVATFAIWSVWPTFGPAFRVIPDAAAAQAIGLVVDAHYGAQMRALAADGAAVIAPGTILGVVAFPSYHTIMAGLVVFYSRRTAVFWPALVLNLVMLPAILVHGAHHVADVLAGAAIFALSAWLASRMVRVGPAGFEPATKPL